MTTFAYATLAALVVAVVYRLSRGCQHEYARPWGPRHKRTEECLRCGHTRPHVAPRGDRTPYLSQLDVDGSDGAPGAMVIIPADPRELARADVARRALLRNEMARRVSTESKDVS